MKVSLSRFAVVTLLVAALLTPCTQTARADATGATATAIASWTGITLVAATAAYLIWLHRPANRPVDWSPKGPGGWYLGLYTGMSFIPNTDWNYNTPDFLYNAQTPYATTAKDIAFGSSPVVGAKVGYYFHKFPYFGLEGDFFYSRPSIRTQTVTISPPFPPNNRIPGNQAQFPGQTVNQWTLALHLMGRLGFIKDDEVPFGRLQPYLGIGPGFTVVYGQDDSGKNFGIDALVGMRYMIRKNLSVFTEFKVNHQFAVELEHQKLKTLPSGAYEQRAKASFDLTMLTWAVGMCVHFW